MHNCVMIKLTWVLLFWSVILHHSFMFISKPLLVILGLVYCSTVRKHTNSVLGKASCDVHEITKTTHFICFGPNRQSWRFDCIYLFRISLPIDMDTVILRRYPMVLLGRFSFVSSWTLYTPYPLAKNNLWNYPDYPSPFLTPRFYAWFILIQDIWLDKAPQKGLSENKVPPIPMDHHHIPI